MGDRGSVLLRLLDRGVGIPFLGVCSLLVRKKTFFPQTPGRIGVLATAAIGDTILLSAVLADLVRAKKNSKVTLFVGPTNQAIARMSCPEVEIVPIPVSNPLKAMRIIRTQGFFDLWLDFGPWPRINAVLSLFSRSGYTLGFKTAKQYRHFCYDQAVPHLSTNHEIDNLRQILVPLGIKSRSIPRLSGFPYPECAEPYIIIHMFPGGYKSSFKEWSRKNWVSLVDLLTDEGHNIVLTGAGKDLAAAEAVLAECRNQSLIDNRAGRENLEKTAGLLEYARAVISVNTGIMHLAAALSVPMVALHGPTNVNRWGPLSEMAVNLTATTPSSGCLNLGFEYDRRDPHSMDTIDPHSVYCSLNELLKAQ
jgi:ADP-heptose:LPS heptosyltransferase